MDCTPASLPSSHVCSGSVPVCPYCTRPARLVDGRTVGARAAHVWHCAPCRAWVPTYPNSPTHKPMGTLAKSDLRALRARAYELIERLWMASAKLNGWSNNRAHRVAYAWMAKQMGMSYDDCRDIGFFDETQTRRVIELVEGLTSRRQAA